MGIKIITDSTSYIPAEYIEKFDIKVVSLNVFMDNESFRELNLDNKTFYTKMDALSEIPKSSQPVPDEMLNVFKSIVENGDSILGIFLSSNMSGTYSSANLIKNMILEDYPNADINIIDSKTNCMQMGFAAIEAARLAIDGKSMDEVIDRTNKVLSNSKFIFSPDTLDYLKKGGRIGSASALLGSILQIKPILTVTDGTTSVFTKVRTRKKAIDKLVSTFFEEIDNKGLGDVIVHHINCEEEGLQLASYLEKKLNTTVKIQSIGPVIGLHVGPGSIGIAFYTNID
ncbi:MULTISPECIES: DegV family protein [Paraclostridium]|uniref:DegV family protein n=1 Tax=Paraclostridium TaxID=1849822 RepID=UPI0012433B9E|nr:MULTISPECIES: DegV family protein [Paraclostridium]MBZ6005158.1 DegV family protein [Paraclostridium bifermentans]MDU0296499.1 DegV family protein [Paraclostridium sp. MRS3W1]